MQLPSNRKAKNQDYLAIARKYHFLFLKSQYKQIWTKFSQIDTTPSAPPSDYNPILDVFIPTKYHDIIPKDPIYMNNHYVVPGSCEWFTYMYNVDESFYPLEDKTARYNRKCKYIARRPIYCTQVSDKYVVEKTQQQRIEKLKADALIKEATYHGTTPKHYYSCTNTVTSLTNTSDIFIVTCLIIWQREKRTTNTVLETLC
ncbi:unnamed protein product [Rhizophagus irregularis]|nr:unnamed protein product [Rhizophagus irregularis]